MLGSFDPATLIISLNAAQTNTGHPKDHQYILSKTKLPIIAHELAHFIQTTTTATGFRLFELQMDLLDVKIKLIQQAVRLNQGKIIAPILPNQACYSPSSSDFSFWKDCYIETQSKLLYHFGGWYVPLTLARSTQTLLSNLLYRATDYSLFGEKRRWPLVLLDLSEVNGTARAVALGARHLREASSKVIDMIQTRLTEASGMQTFNASKGFKQKVPTTEERQLADPYFLCNWLYTFLVARIPDCESGASIEEFVAIADLAMMVDVWISNWKKVRTLSERKRSKALSDLDTIDVSPGENYVRLLTTFRDSWRRLNRICYGYKQKDVAEFQNQLLREAGWNVNLEELVMNCEVFAKDCFAQWRRQSVVPPNLLTTYMEIFKEMLRWRREILGGGAVILNLTALPTELNDLFLSIVPAFVVGHGAFSTPYSAMEDIATDMGNVQHLHELTDALILGNRPCRWQVMIPRACVVSPYSLCDSILHEPGIRPRCVRAQILSMLTNSLNISSLEWRDPEQI